ncbi:MAG TPA: hypothetical protein VIE86_02290 [Nitrososphaera sp.]
MSDGMLLLEQIFSSPSLMLIAGVILGFAISILAVFLTYQFRKPSIIMKVVKGFVRSECGSGTKKSSIGFFQIAVVNIGRSSALDCQIEITFKDTDGKSIAETIVGKWDRGPEPMMDFSNLRFPQPSFVHFSEYANIRPNRSEKFSLFIKVDGDQECYGFGAANYIEAYHDCFRMPSRRISHDVFLAEINIIGGRVRRTQTFLVDNKTAGLDGVKLSRWMQY